jgi:glutathione synthase
MTDKQLLFLADPPAALNPRGDSSLALSQSALEMGYRVTWATPSSLSLAKDSVVVRGQWTLESFEPHQDNPSEKSLAAPWRPVWHPVWHPDGKLYDIEAFDAVWVRKDPPFDRHYLDFCWLLALAFPQATPEGPRRCINSPHGLLTFHEKSLQFAAVQAGILHPTEVLPALVTTDRELLRSTINSWESQGLGDGFVIKPWLGFGGRDVARLPDQDSLVQAWEERQPSGLSIVQPFDPEVFVSGDVRVITAGQNIVGAFQRRPQQGRIESNLAQGGTAHHVELSSRQMDMLQRLISFLYGHGIVFSGVDMIGNRINEVNITSPTGLRSLQALGNQDAPLQALKACLEILR